jgi:hypothetical protein
MEKNIIIIIFFLFIITSCKQQSNDVLIEDPRNPCDFVHNRNLIFKRMIPLKEGKDFDTFVKNKNTPEYKEFFELFKYYSILEEEEKMYKFTDSSYGFCPEYKEMGENAKKVFDNHVSN